MDAFNHIMPSERNRDHELGNLLAILSIIFFLMTKPKNTTKMVRMTVYLTPKQKSCLVKSAKVRKVTTSTIIRELIK